MELAEEILLRSRFDSAKRIREIIAQNKSGMQEYLMQASHGVAVTRAQAYSTPAAAFSDQVKGYGFYRFIEELEANYETRKDEIAERLSEMAVRCLRGNAILQITADEDGYRRFTDAVKPFLSRVQAMAGVPAKESEENKIEALGCLNEGFKTPGMVQFVARTGNFREKGYSYTGALLVLKTLLGFDYLWTNLRVKGGAYGCMCGFGKSGDGYMVSYRDPHLTRTNEIYQAMPEYISKITLDDRELTKYIIGTISELDMPRSAQTKGARAFGAWLSGVTDEMVAKERFEVLHCTEEDIRALAPIVEAVLAADQICVLGSEEKIEEAKDLFGEVKPLFR